MVARGDEGEGGEGVVVTWREAVNKCMQDSFMKVGRYNTCIVVT